MMLFRSRNCCHTATPRQPPNESPDNSPPHPFSEWIFFYPPELTQRPPMRISCTVYFHSRLKGVFFFFSKQPNPQNLKSRHLLKNVCDAHQGLPCSKTLPCPLVSERLKSFFRPPPRSKNTVRSFIPPATPKATIDYVSFLPTALFSAHISRK